MTAHTPTRPAWSCTGCALPWPCPSRRAQLVAEHPTDTLPLARYLAAHLVDAVQDLGDLPASTLYQRFLGWLRSRTPTH